MSGVGLRHQTDGVIKIGVTEGVNVHRYCLDCGGRS